MKYSEVETQEGGDLQSRIEYYESLLDYLDDCVPCLDELIIQFNEGEDE